MLSAPAHSHEGSLRWVPIAELAVTREPGVLLATQALGAGLAVAAHDPETKMGGVLHAMLPDSRLDPEKARRHPGLFVDSGLRALIEEIANQGVATNRLRLLVAGGAEILDSRPGASLGARNQQSFLTAASELGLAVEAFQIGGHDNRSLQLHITSGEVWIKIAGLQKSVLLCKNSTST